MKLSDHILRKPFYVAFGQALQGGGITSVDLVAVRDATTVTMTASDGSAAPIAGADASTAGVMTAVDKSKLDGLSVATTRDFPTRSEVTAAVIGAEVTHVRTAGYSTADESGGALYKRVGAEPAHNLKVQSADGAWWEIVPDKGVLSFRSCGGVEGNSAANGAGNVTAFNDFIDYAQEFDNGENYETYAPTLFFPRGYFHFNDHLNVKAACHIIGESSWGSTGDAGTRLEFPLDSYGLIFHSTSTIDVTTAANSKNAHGSSIQRLMISGGGNTGTTGSGIWMRSAIRVQDCLISGFAEDGIRILARATGGASTLGNANLWYLENVTCEKNGANGLHVNLADSNVGVCVNGNFRLNGRWGVYDSGTFGNTYIGCHTAGNGTTTGGGNQAGEGALVEQGGNRYSAHIGASEADLVATTPGTDETVWILSETGGPSSSIPTWLAAQPEGTYFHGGAYATDGSSNNCVFLGCYREGSQGISQVTDPSIVIGGMFGNNRGVFGTQLRGRDWVGRLKFHNDETFFQTPANTLTLLINDDADALIKAKAEGDDVAGFQLLHFHSSDGYYIIGKHGTSNSSLPLWITTNLTTTKAGRASKLIGGKALFAQGVWIGSSVNNIRQHSNGNSVPSSGEYARGDITWHRDPTAGGPLGWVCVTAGSPGTWVEIRGTGTQTSGTNQTALTNSTGGTRDGTLAVVGDTSTVDQSAVINDNLTELHTLLDEMRTTLVNFGLMKGSV